MTNKLQTEFDETIGKDGGEKQFIKSLTETFINTKVDSVDKITKKNKKSRQYSRKNMVRTRLTVRR